MSTTTEYETFDFPDDLLAAAEKITLKDLIDTPFTQAWTVSAISNAQHFAPAWPIEGNDERLLFTLFTLVRKMPREERMELFSQTSQLVKDHRTKRDKTWNKARAFKAMKPEIK